MKQHKHAELIKAWADGAEIQVQEPNGLWRDTDPLWTEDRNYRIKLKPQKREWAGLTDEEREDLWQSHTKPLWGGMTGINPTLFACKVEAKLKEKNCG